MARSSSAESSQRLKAAPLPNNLHARLAQWFSVAGYFCHHRSFGGVCHNNGKEQRLF